MDAIDPVAARTKISRGMNNAQMMPMQNVANSRVRTVIAGTHDIRSSQMALMSKGEAAS